MKMLLIDRRCWKFIEGPEPQQDDNATAKDREQFETTKERSLTTIYLGVEDDIATMISDAATGREAWEILRNYFEPVTASREHGLLRQLMAISFDPQREHMGVFLSRVKLIGKQLEEVGCKLPESVIAFCFIHHIPKEYEGVVHALRRLSKSEFTVRAVEEALISEEARIRQEKATYDPTPKEAMIVKPKQRGDYIGRGPKPSLKIITCFKCNKKGHYAKDCYSGRTRESRPDNIGRHAFLLTAMLNGDTFSTEWVIDTGSSYHLCKERELFTSYQPIQTELQTIDQNGRVEIVSTYGPFGVLAHTINRGSEILPYNNR